MRAKSRDGQSRIYVCLGAPVKWPPEGNIQLKPNLAGVGPLEDLLDNAGKLEGDLHARRGWPEKGRRAGAGNLHSEE